MSSLPKESSARKNIPIGTGVLDYFPDALAAVAEVSRVGNEQHNPGTPLHWDRSKSPDEADALIRHFLERGTRDTDGVRHSAKMAWRSLALLQKEIEAEQDAPSAAQGPTDDDFRAARTRKDRPVTNISGRAYQIKPDTSLRADEFAAVAGVTAARDTVNV